MSGFVTDLENNLHRKPHTIGCSLHQDDLSFKANFKYVDATRNPKSFTSTLRKL